MNPGEPGGVSPRTLRLFDSAGRSKNPEAYATRLTSLSGGRQNVDTNSYLPTRISPASRFGKKTVNNPINGRNEHT